jgi:hypothetical protein
MADELSQVWVVRTASGRLEWESGHPIPAECAERYARERRTTWDVLRQMGYSTVVVSAKVAAAKRAARRAVTT